MSSSLKKFIISISLFSVILFGYFVVILIVNVITNNRILIDQKKNILIVGDSGLGSSLDDDMMKSAKNICQNSEPYYLTFFKIKFLISKNYTPDTLIIGFGNHNISNYNDYKLKDEFWKNRLFNSNYLFFKEIIKIKKLNIDYLRLFSVYVRNMCIIPKNNHYQNFMGKFNGLKGHQEKNESEKIIDRIYYYKDHGVSEVCISYLDSIIDISVKNKITPILVSAPVSESYYKLIPKLIKDRYCVIKKKYLDLGIKIIDYSISSYDDKYFFNADHLNIKGAIKFTEEVKTKLSQNTE